MQIILYRNFSKRQNSTLQPSGGVVKDVVMKRECSTLSPTFLINDVDPAVNYVRWNDRYYFVSEIVLQNNNIYEVRCEIDVLASWKNYIGSSSQYVLRSAAASDGTLVDTFYPTKKSPTIRQKPTAITWADNINDGCYVVGIIGGSDSTGGWGSSIQQGCVQYYAMSPSSFNAFAQAVFTDSNWLNFQSSDRYTFNPIQYISSVQWFPFFPSVWGQPRQSVMIGWQLITCVCLIITDPVRVDQYYFDIDDHPQAAARGMYLNSSPFSEYVLKFPPFADVELDGDILAKRLEGQRLIARMETDFISGRANLNVYVICPNTVAYRFAHREVQFGVNIQIAQIAANRIGVASDIVSTALSSAGALLTGNIAGAVTGAASGIISAYQTAQPRVMSTGSNDCLLNIVSSTSMPYLFEIFHPVADEDNAAYGRPLCQTRMIGSLAGYILCANAEIAIPGLPAERDQIIAFMNGGFFYE